MAKHREVIYRPERPDPPHQGPDYKLPGWYLVCQGIEPFYAYHPSYYAGVGEVIDDVISRLGPDPVSLDDSTSSLDFAIWAGDRLMAVVHSPFDDSGILFRTVLFREGWNDSGPYEPPYGWPTRGEWLASGKGKIIIQPNDFVDPDHLDSPGDDGPSPPGSR